MKQEQLKG